MHVFTHMLMYASMLCTHTPRIPNFLVHICACMSIAWQGMAIHWQAVQTHVCHIYTTYARAGWMLCWTAQLYTISAKSWDYDQ